MIDFISSIIINYSSAQAAVPKGEMKFDYEMDCWSEGGEAYAAPPNGTFFFLRTCARVGGSGGQTGAAGGARGLLPCFPAFLWMALASLLQPKSVKIIFFIKIINFNHFLNFAQNSHMDKVLYYFLIQIMKILLFILILSTLGG